MTDLKLRMPRIYPALPPLQAWPCRALALRVVAAFSRHWHMLNLDGAHTLQAELRSLHRKPRGYVEEGAEAEDLLAVEAEVQPKPARQTSLAGFFGALRKPAASCSTTTATAAAAADADTAAAAAAEEEPPEAEGEEAEPAWVASGGKTLEVLDELAVQSVNEAGLAAPQLAALAPSACRPAGLGRLRVRAQGVVYCTVLHALYVHVQVAHVLARDGATLFTAAERAWLHRLAAGAGAPQSVVEEEVVQPEAEVRSEERL